MAAFSGPAHAQVCGEREKFLDRLESRYQEQPTGMGLTNTGTLVELLQSEDGSWTLIMTMPNGRSCLMAAGQNWETFKPDNDSPAL